MNKKYTGLFENIHSVSDIILAMVAGLEKEWVNVKMYTFGASTMGNKNTTCYGCAATNTLCELMGKPFKSSHINSLEGRAIEINFGISEETLMRFERAVDKLRQGSIIEFLSYTTVLENELGFVTQFEKIMLFSALFQLPSLNDKNFKANLHYYKKFGTELKKEGY